jgi:two-component sensor histidine kinase
MPRAIESSPPTVNLLLEEITHRVNNEFTAAIGMLSLTAAHSLNNEVRAALVPAIEHLHNHARVHRALQMPAKDQFIDAAKCRVSLLAPFLRARDRAAWAAPAAGRRRRFLFRELRIGATMAPAPGRLIELRGR